MQGTEVKLHVHLCWIFKRLHRAGNAGYPMYFSLDIQTSTCSLPFTGADPYQEFQVLKRGPCTFEGRDLISTDTCQGDAEYQLHISNPSPPTRRNYARLAVE